MIELLNMDCMDYLRAQPSKSFDLAVVDPPYGIGMSGGNVGYKGFNDLPRKSWDASPPPDEYFLELRRVSINQIVWGGNYFKSLWPSRCYLVWDKGAGFRGRTYAESELAWTSFDANAKTFSRDPLCNGDYKGKIHPTQKPVKLYQWLLENYAKPGQRILDTHLGSGSSAIAAHYFGVDFVGIELDADYFAAATERFNRETAQIALFGGVMANHKNPDIEIGLAALCIHAERGQTLTQAEIAEVCGCSAQIIASDEKRAINKLRELPMARKLYEAITW